MLRIPSVDSDFQSFSWKPLNFPLCWLAISNHNQLRDQLKLQIHSRSVSPEKDQRQADFCPTHEGRILLPVLLWMIDECLITSSCSFIFSSSKIRFCISLNFNTETQFARQTCWKNFQSRVVFLSLYGDNLNRFLTSTSSQGYNQTQIKHTLPLLLKRAKRRFSVISKVDAQQTNTCF